MINVIINFPGDMQAISDELGFEYCIVPEMIDGTYSLILQNPDELDAIETGMELTGLDVIIIGAFNTDGTPYLYGGNAAVQSRRNYSIPKYAGVLRAVEVYDENGNVTETIPYTEATAVNKQVNKYYGWGDRQL